MYPGNTPGPSNAAQVQIPCIIFFALTPFFLFIRIWSRISRRSGLGWDDWTILVSFVRLPLDVLVSSPPAACTLAVQILMMIACDYGFGQHIYHLSTENKLMALKVRHTATVNAANSVFVAALARAQPTLFYVAQIFYKLTINLTKASIVLLYLRIFVQRWFRTCCYVLLGIILAYMVATTASSIWQCSPIEGAWDKSVRPQCISLTHNWYANAAFSIVTDILILCLPMQPLWASKLPINQKRALMLVFALGGFVAVTSIMRATTLNFSTTSPDITYDISSTLWTMIEENVAIICACLPMCRMVLAWIFPKTFRNASSATGGNTSGPTYTFGQGRSVQSQNGDWKPYSGPPQAGGLNRSVVQHSDDTSEDFILTTLPNTVLRDDREGAIRKTTQYQISYEKNPYRKV
ncbi:Uncharacterized protein TPAR_08008 [Tolypocladium paradoxum]|uniref:Rhodopsin domain-containing protein n=1 Tax=Tolypocladium paradoxum TaxID=94208 RepID=A0A2S4KNN0_9HYPO|nr:Uncharacterized protein TPAR_08008 [Tolypocladium paradoxum]